MMVKKYTEDNLKKASDHLFYEIWMMSRLVSILEGQTNPQPASTLTSHTHAPETKLLFRSTGIIRTSQSGADDDVLRVTNNPLIEAFGIHIRALLDFFYTKGRDDDVVAVHFFSSPSVWENARPPKGKEDLKKIKDRVNKEIAHLTYARQKARSKLWLFREIQNDLDKIIEAFLSLVPKNLLGDRWE